MAALKIGVKMARRLTAVFGVAFVALAVCSMAFFPLQIGATFRTGLWAMYEASQEAADLIPWYRENVASDFCAGDNGAVADEFELESAIPFYEVKGAEAVQASFLYYPIYNRGEPVALLCWRNGGEDASDVIGTGFSISLMDSGGVSCLIQCGSCAYVSFDTSSDAHGGLDSMSGLWVVGRNGVWFREDCSRPFEVPEGTSRAFSEEIAYSDGELRIPFALSNG